MSWTPLSHRIHHLPLLLAGPILRRTQSRAVTVWLALKAPRQVELKVYSTEGGTGEILDRPLLQGASSTVQLGKYLHVVAVTATPIDSNCLISGQIYAYDIEFAESGVSGLENERDNLISSLWPAAPDVSPLGAQTISYFDHQLPTFALPPDDLNYLRLVHGSCRKPHGGGRDALPILDSSIEQFAGMANSRPHQLFLTGDQIYGDDVADPMLWALTDAGDTILGWKENLPLMDAQINKNLCNSIPENLAKGQIIRETRENSSESQIHKQTDAEYRYKEPVELKPGNRSDIARDFGGLTAMLVNKPDNAKSHLFGLGEYYAMYLLVWSPVLWCDRFPQGKDVCENAKRAKVWDREAFELESFSRNLWRVRRAIANVPTYTICDDHDVSDDWYLNREWCYRVLGKPLGRRVVQNALLAYAVFQAWGNTPAQFNAGKVGNKLLTSAQKWSESAGSDDLAWQNVAKYLGIPRIDIETGLPKFKLDEDVLILDRDEEVLEWHFTIRSFKHEVIVLDTRTWRGYPTESAIDPPMLLTHKGFEEQIQQPLGETESLNATGEFAIEATLVVVPTNLVGLWVIDAVQKREVEQGKVFNSDAGDAWNFHELAFVKLLSEFFKQRARVIVLTGDIHYAAAVRLSYWSDCHFGDSPTEINRGDAYSTNNRQDACSTAEGKEGVLGLNAANYQSSCQYSVLAQLTASALINEEWKTHLIHTKIKSLLPERRHERLGWNEPLELVKISRINRKRAIAAAVKSKQSLPDWGYRIDWMKRQRARVFLKHIAEGLSTAQRQNQQFSLVQRLWNIISLLWRNRWLQEGDEIVGYSNIAIVSFQWPADGDGEKAVIQSVYWRPLWAPDSVVYSQYFVSLGLDEDD
jgi:hypothetical protein